MAAAVTGISTHILDTALGRPAGGVLVTLLRNDGGWREIASLSTDAEGRVKQLLPDGYVLTAGTYRISFATGDYFAAQTVAPLYPLIEITILVRDPATHYHLPLLLTANGYTTYRGS